MAEQRRGPEYVHAHLVEQRRQRVRRNFSFAVFPMLGIGLAIFFTAIVLPHQRSGDQFERLVRALRGGTTYHTIEYRPNRDREIVVREDWVRGPRRRLEYFGGQFVAYHFSQDGESADYVYERGAKVLRKHLGATLIAPAIERLIADLRRREIVSTRTLPDGTLDVVTRRKRLLITMDPKSGRPTSWITMTPTDHGDETLLRTEVHYDVDSGKLRYDDEMWTATLVEMNDLPDPYRRRMSAIATVGSGANALELLTLDVNQMGDVFYIFRSPMDRPFIEVSDSEGNAYSPVDVYTSAQVGERFVGQQLALRLSQTHLQWPLTITIRSRPLDPRLKTSHSPAAEYTVRFDRPTCFMAPSHWYRINVGDGPLFDYQRTKHYRLALVFQNIMRTPDGAMVDTLAGGAAALEQSENLQKRPEDLRRAISEARLAMRARTEFDGGRLSVARIYILLSELYTALGSRDDARRVLEFARGMVRDGRADSFVAADIERTAKELGL